MNLIVLPFLFKFSSTFLCSVIRKRLFDFSPYNEFFFPIFSSHNFPYTISNQVVFSPSICNALLIKYFIPGYTQVCFCTFHPISVLYLPVCFFTKDTVFFNRSDFCTLNDIKLLIFIILIYKKGNFIWLHLTVCLNIWWGKFSKFSLFVLFLYI